MKITNRFGLPKTLLNAMERDDYSKGNARISVTGLLKPPRIGLLFLKHHDQIEKDIADNIWALFGRAVHKILELGGDEEHISEERLFAEVRGWRISGQIDLQKLDRNRVKVIDYKVTSAYAVLHGKPEWEQQLNVYKWLLQKNTDYEIEGLAVCVFIRDWNRHRAKGEPDYPQSPTLLIPIPMWDASYTEAFIEGRVKLHQLAQADWDMGNEPPPCTDEERWLRRRSYAVVKAGNKRGKVFDTESDAIAYARERGAAYVIETRPGTPIRCEGDYCNVSAWCSQYREWKRSNETSL